MPVDTIASRKDGRPDAGDRAPGTMQAVIVRTFCALGARKVACSPAASKLYRKQLHLGVYERGVVTAGLWVKSGNYLYGRCCVVSASATNGRRPAESIANARTGLGTRSH